MRKLLLLAFFFCPISAAHAAVLINEAAWMGTSISANAEWMELYNPDASPIDLTGWKLVAGNGSPNITLSGSIAAGGFYLLERTSDVSVPTVTADAIYSGALTNSGTTLTLTDSTGTAIDSVDGGTNWANIGGDNASKQTAQRTFSGWITAVGTPRAANVGQDSAQNNTQNTASSTSVVTASSTAQIVEGGLMEFAPIPVLRLVAGNDRVVSANATGVYKAQVYDTKGRVRDDAMITWSFGEGMTRNGNTVMHAYYIPGEYQVVAHGVTGDGGEAYATFQVTVIASGISITKVSSDGIELKNNDVRVADLSGWRIVADGETFIFPQDTRILGGRTILLSPRVTKLVSKGSAELYFPTGDLASVYPVVVQPTPSAMSYHSMQTVEPAHKNSHVSVYEAKEVVAPAAVEENFTVAGAAVAAPAPSRVRSLLSSPWTLGFGGLLVLSAGALILL